jgi:hypothetical protein
MKAKTLLIAAATLAVGAITSQAQVYSQNVVGYVNFNLTNGFNLINNPVDFDGTGTNNNVQTFFGTNMPVGSIVYTYSTSGATFLAANYVSTKTGKIWSGNTNAVNKALNIGGAVFVSTPTPVSLTAVGTVIQGTNIVALGSGYNMVSSVPPIGGDIQTNLNFIPHVGDVVYTWNPGTQLYGASSYVSTKSGAKWNPSAPVIGVGQGVFISTTATTGWTNILVIQ